ncbi:MAG: biopolymer transporter ExbD [Nevskia sp.]|jgi:biopolymer transport protein TolR|nr:biopolymer transporter ExbD [Gammaproteobacteria bacterium]MDH4457861.1 biopolymer transporter ExbD [Nevskia sp.]
MSLRNRAIRKRILRRAGRDEPGAIGLNLVPMIDIFTSLLIFLMLTSTTVQTLRTPKALTLPSSASAQPPNDTPVLTVSNENITLQGETVMTLQQAQAETGAVLNELKNRLMLAPLVTVQGEDSGNLTRGEINIVADRAIPYALLKKIMATCGDAKFARISLSVNRRSMVSAGAAP